MALSLGLLAFVQIVALPGALSVYFFRLYRVAPSIPTIFALSLIANYLGVVSLVLIGLYAAPTLVSIILIEIFLLIYLAYARGHLWLPITGWPIWARLKSTVALLPDRFERAPVQTAFECLGLSIAIYIVAKNFASALAHAGDGFDSWDAIQSWNAWAREWASGTLPQPTYHYPQLLPANWSIPYVLTGYPDLTVFSSSLDRFFMPMMLLAMAWYCLRERQLLLTFLVPLCDRMFTDWLPGLRDESYADVPVAFFSILSALILLAKPRRGAEPKELLVQLVVSAILAFGAVSTKQAGGQWVVVFAVIVFGWNFDATRESVSIRSSAVVVGTLFLASAAWYVYAQYQIAINASTSEIGYVTSDIYNGVKPAARLVAAFGNFDVISWLAVAGTIFALADRKYRVLILAGTIPFLLIWATFFSYDKRNAAVAISFLSLTAAVGWLAIWKLSISRRIRDWLVLRTNLAVMLIFLAGVALIFALSAIRYYPVSKLLRRQYYQEAENLFGPYAAPNGRAITDILLRSDAAEVWSADRYTCTLSIVRALGPCEKKDSAGDFDAALRSLSPSETAATLIFVIPEQFRSGVGELARSKSIKYLQSADGFDLWSNKSLQPVVRGRN